MTETTLKLGEDADEAAWRALVEQGLKGAPWSRLLAKTSDGIALEPLYRETDVATAQDEAGMPGAAPFVRGAGAGWTIRQAFEGADQIETNREILADLQGGVGGIELIIDPAGERGVAIKSERDLDIVLADVILEAAPVSLDAGEHGAWAAGLLRDKLKGVAVRGTSFGLDPLGAYMRSGKLCQEEHALALDFTARHAADLPNARFIRAEAGRIVHEAGATEAQELAAALSGGIHYLRALEAKGLGIASTANAVSFAVSVGPDVLIETAKLRALRLCWARVLEASGVEPETRAAHIHAFTSRRMMTRYDAWTNILRVTTAAFAAAVGGADDITTYPLTDALGLPTAFGRRVARNTQNVLMEECRLGHVADPAGGAWFVEKLTQELAAKAWDIMQSIEAEGGIVTAFQAGSLQKRVAEARAARQKLFATRRETITGVTDFPLLGAKPPEFIARRTQGNEAGLAPIRWADPFETLRDRAEKHAPRIFFANMATLAEFAPRAQFARNFFGVGGIGGSGEEDAHVTTDALIDAFSASGARVAVIASTDACYAEHAENCAQRLKAAGADWIVVAGKPGDAEAKYRTAGVDQFIYVGVDVVKELETLHAALGIGA
jgi:methylmalonyl-CoA mutase